jgi:hypothetical protein
LIGGEARQRTKPTPLSARRDALTKGRRDSRASLRAHVRRGRNSSASGPSPSGSRRAWKRNAKV